MRGPWGLRGLNLGLGAAVALGHAPLSLWPVSLLALCGFIFALHRGQPDLRGAMSAAFFLGLGYFLITLNWIVEPFFIDPLRHGWMAPIALLAMAGGLALIWLLVGIGWHWARGLGVAVGLAIAEYIRAHIFGGFPWGLPAYILLDSPLQGILALIGPYGATLCVALVAATPVVLLSNRVIGGALVALLIGMIWSLMPVARSVIPNDQATQFTVRLVQPNAPQHQKWDPRYAPMFFDRMLDMSARGPQPDLIIWPESAVAEVLNYAQPQLDAMAQANPNSDLLFGILRIDQQERMKNSMALLRQGQLSAIYDKTLLVPFGEYMPWEPVLRPLGLGIFYDWFGAAFAPGTGPQTMTLSTGRTIAPLICYEAIFPDFVRTSAAQETDVIVQITNDAWFGTRSGPAQHLAQARARAIETGLPMIRVANTGISAVISPDGAVIHSIGLNDMGWADVAMPAKLQATLYLRHGDLAFWILAILATSLGVIARRRDNLLTI